MGGGEDTTQVEQPLGDELAGRGRRRNGRAPTIEGESNGSKDKGWVERVTAWARDGGNAGVNGRRTGVG